MASSSAELAEILQRVAAREKDAFEALYRATGAKLYGIIVRIVPTRSMADDLLQEVYLRVWQRADEFDPARASPITWLAAIARNRAIDEIRRRKPEAALDDGDMPDLPADAAHPLDGRHRREELTALMRCLDRLDGEKREIVLLAYCRGMSRDDLARRFTRPVPTIKTWLHRSLAQLKECLSS